MAWKETNLRADLVSRFFAVNPTPAIIESEDPKGITWLQYNVLEVGLSEKDKTFDILDPETGRLKYSGWMKRDQNINFNRELV